MKIFNFLEIIGGAKPLPERLEKSRFMSIGIGIWWAILILAVISFIGRATKFIYVDF